MGGRGGKSGFTDYRQYYHSAEAQEGLGMGNGGETDTWVMSLDAPQHDSIVKYTGSYYRQLNTALTKCVILPKARSKQIVTISKQVLTAIR